MASANQDLNTDTENIAPVSRPENQVIDHTSESTTTEPVSKTSLTTTNRIHDRENVPEFQIFANNRAPGYPVNSTSDGDISNMAAINKSVSRTSASSSNTIIASSSILPAFKRLRHFVI